MGRRGGDAGRRASSHRQFVLDRGGELIEFLMANDGFVKLTANELAGALAARYGNVWMTMSGRPNKLLVTELKQLMHDQHCQGNEDAYAKFAGYMMDYAPNDGGFVLIGVLGEMAPEHLLHMLAGYLHQQVSISTILRRSTSQWRTAGEQASRADDFELTNVLAKIEDQIDRQGSVDHSTIDEFRRLMDARGFEVTV